MVGYRIRAQLLGLWAELVAVRSAANNFALETLGYGNFLKTKFFVIYNQNILGIKWQFCPGVKNDKFMIIIV